MTKQEILDILKELNLTQREAAVLLSVDVRTLRRWIRYPERANGPAIQALLGWQKLHRLTLAWGPNQINIIEIPHISKLMEINQ